MRAPLNEMMCGHFRELVARERALELEYARASKKPNTIDEFTLWFMEDESRDRLRDDLFCVREEIANIVRSHSAPIIDKYVAKERSPCYWLL